MGDWGGLGGLVGGSGAGWEGIGGSIPTETGWEGIGGGIPTETSVKVFPAKNQKVKLISSLSVADEAYPDPN